MKILFIQTGGTIDKDYPKVANGYAFEITTPAVERILKRTNPNFESEIISLFKKDSLDITEEDRGKIKEACESTDADKIIITHGTDTMVQTAEKLSQIKDKTIILTGASRPERFFESDASFNIGVAVAAVELCDPGIYIAMSGRIYPYDKVKKNPQTGQFIETA